MLEFVGHIYWLMLPAIVGGVLNMVWVKLPILKSWQKPMDGGKKLKDGRRIFGDNKTWKGFFGMIAFTAISAWVFGVFGFFSGAWLGFAYVVAELPNSFIKRRLDVPPGKSGGIVQTFFDQADSAIGYALLLFVVYPATWQDMAGLVVIGTITHYIVNILLFFAKLKNQKG